MAKHKFTTKEFEQKKHELVKLLKLACKNYDDGEEMSALNIATNLRVILHDTSISTSLLSLIKVKDKIKYLSSVHQYLPTNLVSYFGLGYISASPISGLYRANLDMNLSQMKLLDFDDWWNEIVIGNAEGKISRKNVVLGIANKEGGAHVSDDVDLLQYKMITQNGLGWEVNGISIETNVYYVCLRTIAYELLMSFDFYDDFDFIEHNAYPSIHTFKRYFSNGNLYFIFYRSDPDGINERINKDDSVEGEESARYYMCKYKNRVSHEVVLVKRLK